MLILAWWLLTGFLEDLRWIFAYLLPFIAQEFARKNLADIGCHTRHEIYFDSWFVIFINEDITFFEDGNHKCMNGNVLIYALVVKLQKLTALAFDVNEITKGFTSCNLSDVKSYRS
ncbi:hypothetical protein NTE11_001386 [Vibrio fluvialis]|uniref:Uncharacterized protein n=1 Tax=Vibrio diazotrophicus TaxID=685 RepID=A0ABX4W549_VIBDI|nr:MULTISPECIES: hypothetical protein [Vibrio]EKO3450426.1 hypothetical protein [Vibrio fluvialis]EKO3459512.1 hypothetical protein [Vibrio fluvialis]EMA2480045.1 hypothetical protein [Vibrio fluvialis]MBY7834202.1 hypothetical protein [Vibrio fluvialis]MCG6399718.1 hypothetical protein [Vibrio fluvialis]